MRFLVSATPLQREADFRDVENSINSSVFLMVLSETLIKPLEILMFLKFSDLQRSRGGETRCIFVNFFTCVYKKLSNTNGCSMVFYRCCRDLERLEDCQDILVYPDNLISEETLTTLLRLSGYPGLS